MAFSPDPPFPKARGDVVRSTDWNEAINEVVRLGNDKVNKAGDNITGSLTIAGSLGVKTTTMDRPLTIQGSELVSFKNAAGATKWHINDRSGSGDLNIAETNVADARLYLRAGGNVGIGTTSPGSRLEVKTDANNSTQGIVAVAPNGASTSLRPHMGQGNNNNIVQAGDAGIIFSQGTIDSGAFVIAPWANATSGLRITATGNVGIGTPSPASDRLDVAGSARLLTGSNPIRFTGQWSGFPDTAANQAEISNDTGTYKTLMIIGNRSAGKPGPGIGRRVSVWDILEVNGILRMGSELDILFRGGDDPNHGLGWYGPYPGGYGKLFNNTAVDGPVLYGFTAGALGTTRGGQRIALFWKNNGAVGVGTTDPLFPLHVNGDAAKPGGGFWTATSDVRLKKGIEQLTGALDKLTQLRGVSFEWKEPAEQGNLTGPQLGMVAQEVEKVFPEWVDTDTRGFKTLTVRGFEALVVEAFKELKGGNEALKAKHNELENRLEALETKLADR